MKNNRQIYWEYYHPNEKDIKGLSEKAVYVFDSCSLLQIYWLGDIEQKELFIKLEKLKKKNRLWIPYQFFKEYLKNRVTVISQIDGSIQKDMSLITEKSLTFLEGVSHGQSRNILRKLFIDLDTKSKKKITAIKTNYSNWIDDNNDPILSKISKIYNGNIGSKPDYIVAKKQKDLALERFKFGLSPGFTDKSKEINNEGDAVAWIQILEKYKLSKKSLVLLTEETKKDWYEQYIANGKIAPSRYLCREYHDKCKGLFNIINLKMFISETLSVQGQPVEPTQTGTSLQIVGSSGVNLSTNNINTVDTEQK